MRSCRTQQLAPCLNRWHRVWYAAPSRVEGGGKCWVFPPQQDNSHECYDLGLGISFSLMVNATDYHARNAGSTPAYCLNYSAESRY